MEYRAGKCSQCGAEYQIPASFAHNVARCKKCRGVVHLSAPAKGARANAVAPEPKPVVPAPDPARASSGSAPVSGKQESAEPPAREPRPSAPRPAPVAASATPNRAAETRAPASADRVAPEPARAPGKAPIPVLLGLGVLLVLALLYFFRGQLFGGGEAAKDTPAQESRQSTGGASTPVSTPATPPADAPAGGSEAAKAGE